MERGVPTPLAASEIHGFNTTADLDIEKLFDDASKRWFRPNEIHALLSNYTLLKIQPQPVMNPGNGSLLLFDRNMLRNFRKDGHNWRKKKDGKTVQEAHEKLKIGNDERIHVYYARGEDDPNFYRRCYWLLDRKLERIVLVHYRQTSEDIANQQLSASVVCKDEYSLANSLHGSPVLSMSSGSGSNNMEASGSLGMSEEIHLSKDSALVAGFDVSVDDKFTEFESRDLSIDMINKFDWTSLVQPQSSNYHDGQSGLDFRNHADLGNLGHVQSNFSRLDHIDQQDDSCLQPFHVDQGTPMQAEALQSHNSLSQWDFIIDENPPASFNLTDVQTSDSHASKELPVVAAQPYQSDGVFVITDASPAWSYADEETKVIVVGFFHEAHKHLENSNMFLVFGDTYVPAERVQFGVYKSIIQPRTVGSTNFFLSLDKQTPISNTLNYDVRAPVNTENSSERDIEILIRLIRLLFSSNNRPSQSSTSSSTAMKGARRFRSTTLSLLEKDWTHLLKLIRNNGASSSSINQQLLELVVKNKLQEWLLSKIAEGQRTTEMDSQGLGVIHLCAVLDYTWAAHLFKVSGLSLDFRDIYGWTALHWAAYSGRVKMVAALLSSGANPSLVTDPTPEIPGGCTAADLASQAGYEGLAAFLAEKALAAHFAAMTLSGNARGPREPANPENIEAGNSEQEVLLKYSLAAYRNAADAADRIHSALRDRSLRLRVKAAQLSSSQANEVLIISALKIQKAYRDHNSRKMMKAAARIQGTFRTWQARKNFLALRRHAVKIQAAFRGLLVRLSYRKILWSVGVLEKAVLRWRMKRKGLRGLQIDGEEGPVASAQQENSASEEEFFRVSREQAEERVDRSVVRVQAMFRSHQAQQEYRKMKLAHDQAQLEYDEFTGYDGG